VSCANSNALEDLGVKLRWGPADKEKFLEGDPHRERSNHPGIPGVIVTCETSDAEGTKEEGGTTLPEQSPPIAEKEKKKAEPSCSAEAVYDG